MTIQSNEQLCALVSGYPSRYRPLKPLVVLQAYVDDSASDVGDQRLFMAGYVSNAENWMGFSDAWDWALRQEPKIDYLHMVEAQNLRGQFKGWSEPDRDLKLEILSKVIEHFEIFSISISVSRKDYMAIVAPVAPYFLKSPYFGCYWGVIQTLARHLNDTYDELKGQLLPVDFIFDEHSGLSGSAHLWFKWLKETQPPEWKNFIGSTPIFRDDRKIVALQAADMLVWHLRRQHERKGKENLSLLPMLCGNGVGLNITREALEAIAGQISKVPSVDLIQTKGEWQKLMPVVAALIDADYPPPDMPFWRMRLLRFSVGFRPKIRKMQRLFKRYLK